MNRAEKEHLVFFCLYVLGHGEDTPSRNAFQSVCSGEKLEEWDRMVGQKAEVVLRSSVIFSSGQWTCSDLLYHSHLG